MREPITAELREIVPLMPCGGNEMTAIADRIDAEHKRRMDDCRRNVRREAVRYMRGVLTDLDRGVRRVRKGDKTEVVRCKDCVHAYFVGGNDNFCGVFDIKGIGADDFCSNGERREVEE
jgi:hypothetical protein